MIEEQLVRLRALLGEDFLVSLSVGRDGVRLHELVTHYAAQDEGLDDSWAFGEDELHHPLDIKQGMRYVG